MEQFQEIDAFRTIDYESEAKSSVRKYQFKPRPTSDGYAISQEIHQARLVLESKKAEALKDAERCQKMLLIGEKLHSLRQQALDEGLRRAS
jgi:hypothetical protein